MKNRKIKVIVTIGIILAICTSILLYIEFMLPKKKVIGFYESAGCRSNYFPDCLDTSITQYRLLEDDKDYIATTDNGLVDKQFLFVYKDKESKDKINLDYMNLRLKPTFKGSVWEIYTYNSSFEQIDLSKESQDAARKRLFNQYKTKRIELMEKEVKLNGPYAKFKKPYQDNNYFEETYAPPHNFIGNDEYQGSKTSLKYFTSSSYFGLWRQNESERISFEKFIDTQRGYKWVNNIQGDKVVFGASKKGNYTGEIYVYNLETMDRILKINLNEGLFGNVFLDYSGTRLIFDVGKFNADDNFEFDGRLRIFLLEDGKEAESINIPKGEKHIKLKEKALFLEYYDESGNVVKTMEVEL